MSVVVHHKANVAGSSKGGDGIPSSCKFITPGALEVVLRFFASNPATAESTLVMSDVSADMMTVGLGCFEAGSSLSFDMAESIR